jgi:hypothetical protein
MTIEPITIKVKLDFKKYGAFPDSMKYSDGTYVDSYWMMKKLEGVLYDIPTEEYDT